MGASIHILCLFALLEATSSAKEDDLKALEAVSEVRLFTDEQVQDDLDKKYLAKYKIAPGPERSAFVNQHNLTVHKAMIAVGMREGLPLQIKGALLPERDAMVMQALSKDLREAGFVSVAAPKTSSAERAKAFGEWCAGNRVEKFSGVPATLMQMLQVEGEPIRLAMIGQLEKIKSSRSTVLLARCAIMDLSPKVRNSAVQVLKKRRGTDYLPVFVKSLRYPLPIIAERAADALGELRPQEAIDLLLELLDKRDPRAPIRDPKTKKLMIREVVRINHLRNCLLCHAPSGSEMDGLVRGSIPPPPLSPKRKHLADASAHGALERLRKTEQEMTDKAYYNNPKADFIRADITFLRQDFSAVLRVRDADPWPELQRFDFVTRTRPAKPEDIAALSDDERDYPQRRAVLRALRAITKKDAGESTEKWRDLISIPAKQER